MNPSPQFSLLVALNNPQESAALLSTISNSFRVSISIIPEENALQHTFDLLPDFVIMEGLHGLTLTKEIKKSLRCPTKCIVFFSRFDQDLLLNAIFTNADAYFLKTSTNQAINDCIMRLLGGERYITPSLSAVFQNPKIEKYRNTIKKLTTREHEVFRHLGYNRSIKQIAALHYISESTVKNHKDHIIEKLDLTGSRELRQMAAEYLNLMPQ